MREKHRNKKRLLFCMMLCLFLLITQNVFAGVQSIQPEFISPISVLEQESGSEEIVDAEENSGLEALDFIEQLIAAFKAFKENAESILGSINAFVDGDDAAASSAIAASDEIFDDFNALYDQLEDSGATGETESWADITDVQWTCHDHKHFPQKNLTWKENIESTKNGGNAKYSFDIQDIEAFERDAWKTGTPVTTGKTWKVKAYDKVIGASDGKETKYVRIEYSSGVIHGHPITENEYRKLTKKRK